MIKISEIKNLIERSISDLTSVDNTIKDQLEPSNGNFAVSMSGLLPGAGTVTFFKLADKILPLSSKLISCINRLRDLSKKIEELENNLEYWKNESSYLIKNKLDEIKENNIKLEKELKDRNSQLTQKDDEINKLREEKELIKKELLTKKLCFKKKDFELFATQTGVSSEQINSLSKFHEKLALDHKNYDQINIDVGEENITQIKQDILNQGVNIVYVQKIFQKLAKIANLQIELNQFQPSVNEKQSQPNLPSNYSTNRERNWRNIHPDFTPELVQEWKGYGFSYEECADWINIIAPSQRALAIQKPAYHAWLRDKKKVSVEWVLNNSNVRELIEEFFAWQHQQYQTRQEANTCRIC